MPDKENVFSKENRVRLIYILGDLLQKPRPHSLGGYEGGEEFFKLDELLRRRLGRLELVPGAGRGFDAVIAFIQVAPEDQLLDLIELTPVAKVPASGHGYAFRSVTEADLRNIRNTLNWFLQAIGSRARFEQGGVFNPDGFEVLETGPLAYLPRKDELSADLQALLSEHELLSLILLDLDNFKAVNDRHGHDRGDECLGSAASIIGAAIARKGKLYRFREGDEFAVILRNATTAEAIATADRIRKAIEETNPGGDVKVTASIGVASSGKDGINTADKLLEVADEAMYVSKYTMKNCVTAWPVPLQALTAARERRSKAQDRKA